MTNVLTYERRLGPGASGSTLVQENDNVFDVIYPDGTNWSGYCLAIRRRDQVQGSLVAWRRVRGAEATIVQTVGLNPDDWVAIRVPRDRFAPVSDIQTGQWFSWGEHIDWFRLTRLDPDGTHHYDRVQTEGDDTPREESSLLAWSEVCEEYLFSAGPFGDQVEVTPSTITPQHQRDLDEISRILLEEAEHREWCAEYDQVIERINRTILGNLHAREREFQVWVSINGAVRQSVMVRSTSQEQADRLVRDRLLGLS